MEEAQTIVEQMRLEPCPFCGAPAEKWRRPDPRSAEMVPSWEVLGCRNTACLIRPSIEANPGKWSPKDGNYIDDQYPELARRWNTRALIPALSAGGVAPVGELEERAKTLFESEWQRIPWVRRMGRTPLAAYTRRDRPETFVYEAGLRAIIAALRSAHNTTTES